VEAIKTILKEVENGKRSRPNMNKLHELVTELVKPKRAPKKVVFEVYRKKFPNYQVTRGRPRKKK